MCFMFVRNFKDGGLRKRWAPYTVSQINSTSRTTRFAEQVFNRICQGQDEPMDMLFTEYGPALAY